VLEAIRSPWFATASSAVGPTTRSSRSPRAPGLLVEASVLDGNSSVVGKEGEEVLVLRGEAAGCAPIAERKHTKQAFVVKEGHRNGSRDVRMFDHSGQGKAECGSR